MKTEVWGGETQVIGPIFDILLNLKPLFVNVWTITLSLLSYR